MDEQELDISEKLSLFFKGAIKDFAILTVDKYLPIPLVQMLFNGCQEIENERARRAMEAIKKKAEAVEPDPKFIRTEECYDIFTLTLSKMLKTRSQEKIELFANIIANEMSKNRNIDYTQELKESFIRIIADLSSAEIDLLYEIHLGNLIGQTRKAAYSRNQEKNAAIDSLIAKGLLTEESITSRLNLTVLGGLLKNYITSFLPKK